MTPPNRPKPPARPAPARPTAPEAARPSAPSPARATPRPAPRPSGAPGGALRSRVHAAVSRPLHFLMRDGTAIEGVVQVGENQSLISFLNSRSGWMSVTNARRSGTEETPGHMIIHADHIVMASSPDGAVQVAATAQSSAGDRLVELVLVGGRVVRGYVPAAPGQRLSDCIATSGKFIGVSLARLFPEGTDVGDVALQNGSLEIVRDLSASPQETAE